MFLHGCLDIKILFPEPVRNLKRKRLREKKLQLQNWRFRKLQQEKFF